MQSEYRNSNDHIEENNQIVITKMFPPNSTKEAIVSAVLEEGKLAEIYLEDPQQNSRLRNIYVGRVHNIVNNINAAFIVFEKDCIGYYPLEELPTAIFTKKQGKKPLVIGDELLVQVVKEPVKTKAAMLTTNLNFSGKYFVITTGRKGIGMSGKLSISQKRQLREFVKTNLYHSEDTKKYGIIVRTNAREATEEQLLSELSNLKRSVEQILKKAPYQVGGTRISEANKEYISLVRNAYMSQIQKIVTDSMELYEHLKEYLEEFQPQDIPKLHFYQDKQLSLQKLYNLELQIEHALKSHIWLKSGAYLILEQTEAFTVIDVNTGKFDGKKQKKDTFLKINLEAAKEVARQMRLRNLSGIILIDFINMEREEDNTKLLEDFRAFVKLDRIQTTVVDMTALGIVEVTRKKEHGTLNEALKKLI